MQDWHKWSFRVKFLKIPCFFACAFNLVVKHPCVCFWQVCTLFLRKMLKDKILERAKQMLWGFFLFLLFFLKKFRHCWRKKIFTQKKSLTSVLHQTIQLFYGIFTNHWRKYIVLQSKQELQVKTIAVDIHVIHTYTN